MNRLKTGVQIIGTILLITLAHCKGDVKASPGKVLVLNDLTYKENPQLDDIARLIAAKPLSEGSYLLPIANSPKYKKYYDEINSAWNNFENKHLNIIDKWIDEHPTSQCGVNLFYPFSGPDILHALKFYPQAQSIHMFALERFGGMPQPDPSKPDAEAKKLFSLITAIKSSLDYHYFITSYMSEQVGENAYSGVIAIMLFGLARLDMKVLDIYPVAVNEQGKLEKTEIKNISRAHAIAIFFQKPGEKNARVALYFKGDASDKGLAKSPELQAYIKSLSGYSTLLKAASYLMYDKTFDDMRNQILGQSQCILSESSGIPYHYLNNGHWDLTLYGVYKGPLVYFKNRFDPVFFKDMKSKAEPLPFDYGYRRGQGMSHIIFAQRKKDYPYFKPEFDGSAVYGETTSWNNGQSYFIIRPPKEEIEGRLKYNKHDKAKVHSK